MKYLLADASKDRCSVCKYTLGPDEIICGMCGATRPPGSEPLQIPADRDSPWSEILNYPQARVIHEDRCRDCGHAFKRPEALLCRMCGTPRPEKLVYPKARSVVQDRCRECNHPFKRPDFMQCRMCGTPRIEKKDPPKVRGDVPQDRCRECNYKFMRPEVLTCRMCGTRRPEPEALKVSESPPRGESAEPAEQASSPRAAKEAKASVSKVEPAVLPRDEKQTLQQAQSRSVPSKMLSAKEWLSVPRRRCRADVSVSRLQELAIFASILCVSEIVFAAIIRSQTGGPVG